MLSIIHTRWWHSKASLWYLSILSYSVPYTAVGNWAGQIFFALKVSTFPLEPLLRAHAKVTLSFHSFQHIGLEQQLLSPRQNPMGFWPKKPDGKFPLSPGLCAITQDVHVGDKGHPCWYRGCLHPHLPIFVTAAVTGLWPEGSQLYPNLLPKLGNWVRKWHEGGCDLQAVPEAPLAPFPLQNHLQWGAERSYCWFHFARKAKTFLFMPKRPAWPFPSSVQEDIKIKAV